MKPTHIEVTARESRRHSKYGGIEFYGTRRMSRCGGGSFAYWRQVERYDYRFFRERSDEVY